MGETTTGDVKTLLKVGNHLLRRRMARLTFYKHPFLAKKWSCVDLLELTHLASMTSKVYTRSTHKIRKPETRA